MPITVSWSNWKESRVRRRHMLKKVFLSALCAGVISQAGVVRMEVKERSDVLEGRAFGKTGGYERIVGKVYFAIDPKLPVNHVIADIDKAPRNKGGMVEFSSDFYLLRPKDLKQANSAAFYQHSHRSNTSLLT